MTRALALRIVIVLAGLLPVQRARAAMPWSSSPSQLCRAATSGVEQVSRIPDQLLSAISKVESGRVDPQTGTVQAWPWTINAEGVGHYYESKADAIAAAQAFQAQGIRSIDVGCLQVNLSYHPNAFASLDQAFDPQSNAAYAASFLQTLFQQQGSWPHAAAAYHSLNPGPGADYQRRVLETWAQPDRPTGPRVAVAKAAPLLVGAGMAVGAAPPVTTGGAHIIRMAGAPGLMATGRGLDAYRGAPIPVIFRPFRSN
ncbi:MAG: transglycosylase SLT domain-containing protein [Janthinobacterium lividum]